MSERSEARKLRELLERMKTKGRGRVVHTLWPIEKLDVLDRDPNPYADVFASETSKFLEALNNGEWTYCVGQCGYLWCGPRRDRKIAAVLFLYAGNLRAREPKHLVGGLLCERCTTGADPQTRVDAFIARVFPTVH